MMKLGVFIRKNPVLLIGSLMLFSLLFFTFVGPYLSFIDSETKQTKYIWKDNIPWGPPFTPSKDYIFGSDRLGRDIASLLVMGAKETLFIVVMISIIRYTLAIPLAFLAHKQNKAAQAILHFLNGYFAYVPSIVVFVLIATLPPILTIESRPLILMLFIAIMEIGRAADMIKGEFDSLSAKEFILGGISIGASPFRMLMKYYLPFLYDKIIVGMIADMGKVMFLLGQVGFIGIYLAQELLQINPGVFVLSNKSMIWPVMFGNAFNDLRSAIWIVFYPALVITYSIFAFNLFAQGLQNLLGTKGK